MSEFENIILKSKVTKWFLYTSLAALNFAVAVDVWSWQSVVGTIVAFLFAWKTFMSNPDTGIKKDQNDK